MATFFGETHDERVRVEKVHNDSFNVFVDGNLTQEELDAQSVIRYLLHVIPYIVKTNKV